jgi:hypothetical protein
VALVVNPALVNDNAFSDKSNKAYTKDADYPSHRSAKRLTDSEFAQFSLTVGDYVCTWSQGYADQPGGYNNTEPTWYSSETAGAGTGTPPPGYVSSSSFVWNLNNYANNPAPKWNMNLYGTDRDSWMSPFESSNPAKALGLDCYTTLETAGFSSYYQWEWPMVYEWSIDLTSFGTAPIFVISAMSHHSPPKTGDENDAFPEPPGNGYLSDYGDLPAPYPTLLADNGACHYIVPSGARLGNLADPEPDGLTNRLAFGDDISVSDDEDGVVLLTPLVPGGTAVIRVTAGTAGYLSAFIDWDGNGTLDSVTLLSASGPTSVVTGILGDTMLATNGVYDLTIQVPVSATGAMPARFRYTNAPGEGGNNAAGLAVTGEVEDYIFTASIGDRVWLDTNGNGIQDAGEAGMDGVTVNLYRPGCGPDGIVGNGDDADAVGVTNTVGGGAYTFGGLIPSGYTIKVVKPAGYSFSLQDQGADDALDSDADLSTGMAATTLYPGASDTAWDAGLYVLASLGDFVWFDSDGDGVQDEGEPGIGAVRVYVDLNGNGSYDLGEPNSVTDANGAYLIEGLVPGTQTVRVEATSLPAGLLQTYDFDGVLDFATTLALISGENRTDVDFGYCGVGSIGDRVFADYNNNGIWDVGEGIAGVDVTVNGDRDGDGNSDSFSVTTGADGYYLFANLYVSASGVPYTVTVNTADLPAGLTLNTADPDGGGNSTSSVSLTLAQPVRQDQDFGYRSLAVYAISGQVRDDYDLNGVFSEHDLPVGGVLVTLYTDPNGDGNPADGVALRSVFTAKGGTYVFSNVIASAYVVVESDPGVSVSMTDSAGANDNSVSVVILNADSVDNDFLDAIDPSGYLYDTADGRIVSGGSISVSGPSVSILMDGSSGLYMFISTNDVPASYTVTVTPPPGYVIDPTRPALPGSFDPTGVTNTIVVGGTNVIVFGSYATTNSPRYLIDYSAESNTYYYVFDLQPDDPYVINNNFPLKFIEITGTVFEDTNRLTDNTVNGTGTDAGGLYANLVNPSTQAVIACVPVNVDGSYRFVTTNGVEQNTAHDVILTRTAQDVGVTLGEATLPTTWVSTGEHVGADSGSDGTIDGRLSLTTTDIGVTEVNFGIVQVPDITPIITAVPNVMHAVQNFYITVQIAELLSIDTEGLITVRIPIDPRWVLNGPYVQELTMLGTTALNNDDWAYSKDATHHIFTSSVAISAGASSYFGFNAAWDAGLTQGFYTITSQIDSDSGGENRIDNNVDAEKIDYFIQ